MRSPEPHRGTADRRRYRRGAEIGARALHRLAEVGERGVRIRARIADDDVAATAPQQFVQPEILEVAAVGEMDARILLVEPHAEHLAHHEVIPGRPAKRRGSCRGLATQMPRRMLSNAMRKLTARDFVA